MNNLKVLTGIFLGLMFFWIISSSAVKADDVSLSDAVFADLALRHQLDNISVYYFDGVLANNIQINDTRPWVPASTIKLYVAMYAYYQIAQGKLNLSDNVTIKAQNVVPTELVTTEFPLLQEGERVTVYRLITQMITQSDNTAYNTLLDLLDRREVTKYTHDLGLINSSVGSKFNLDDQQVLTEYVTRGFGDNVTTANDFATAFVLIKGGRIPGSASLEGILERQKLNSMLPRYLPSTVIVAHKTGDLAPLYHDGGIIIDKQRSYVLSIFSNSGSPEVLAHLSQLIYTKNYGLVGQILKNADQAEIPSQALDPLILNSQPNQEVLGESTGKAIPVPEITAADLGITLQDLLVTITNEKLPTVIIPTDSILHPAVQAWLDLSEDLAILPSVKAGVRLEHLKLELAEAVDLERKGKKGLSIAVLADINQKLTDPVFQKGMSNNSALQTTAKAISETRFQIMSETLATATPTDRSQIIKIIASQARDEITKIAPAVPQAITATAPSQKPVIGQVLSNNSGSLVIQTNTGRELNVSSDTEVNTRAHDQVNSVKRNLKSVTVGSTVALVGTSQGSLFVPTFVMTNLPRQLVAPVPSVVLKVNTKNQTIVVNQEGTVTQVDLTSRTSVKGSDTNISLNQVNVGDVVVVRGIASPSDESLIAPTQTNHSERTSTKTPPNLIGSPAEPEKFVNSTRSNPVSSKPQVIEGVVIQVVEKHQDISIKQPATKAETPTPSSQSVPLPVASQAPTSSQPTDIPNKVK